MLLVHLGSPEDGEQFFAKRWPEARAVSDENEELYEAFGLKQASAGQLFGLTVILAGLKAIRHGVGKPVGNPRRMSGWFLIDGDSVVWSDIHEHAGSERPYGELERAYGDLRGFRPGSVCSDPCESPSTEPPPSSRS